MKTFLEKLEHRFLVGSTKIKNASFPYKTAISKANVFHTKLPYQKPMLRQINGPITKNGVLSVATLSF